MTFGRGEQKAFVLFYFGGGVVFMGFILGVSCVVVFYILSSLSKGQTNFLTCIVFFFLFPFFLCGILPTTYYLFHTVILSHLLHT